MDFRVISIGALAHHPLRGERPGTRTGHATTTLLVSGAQRVLVDPGLPEQVLLPRLQERAGLSAKDITDVFLTSFTPDHTRGLGAFPGARWLVHEAEREAVGVQLATALKDLLTRSDAQGGVAKDQSLRAVLERDVALLARCQPAPEKVAERVDIFPLPGVTPGLCGLLVSHPRFTVVVAGDAIATHEHAEQGRVVHAPDIDRARTSFEDVIEMADLIIPGRDNILLNPTKKPF